MPGTSLTGVVLPKFYVIITIRRAQNETLQPEPTDLLFPYERFDSGALFTGNRAGTLAKFQNQRRPG